MSVRACGRPRERRATATAELLTVPTQDSTNAVILVVANYSATMIPT